MKPANIRIDLMENWKGFDQRESWLLISLMIMTASLIHIVGELSLLVAGGGHPLVVGGGHGGRVRGVQASLQQSIANDQKNVSSICTN